MGSVQMLALGRISGFDGDLVASSAVAEGERPLQQAAWKAAVLQDPMDYQDTFQMLLPPIKTKYAQDGNSIVVWMKGVTVRSHEARVAREKHRQERWEKHLARRQAAWEDDLAHVRGTGSAWTRVPDNDL